MRQASCVLGRPEREFMLHAWADFDSTRTQLISNAKPLDNDDEALYRFSVRLNIWNQRGWARKYKLDDAWAQYQRQCVDTPLGICAFRAY
jgi:hypothetical protein